MNINHHTNKFNMQKQTPQYDTYICNTEEGYEKGCNYNEEGEQLSVLVEAFKLINQPCDHRFHPTHLQQKTQELE